MPGRTACAVDSNEIATTCQEAKQPVNLLSRDGLPSPEELKRLGVRRLSASSRVVDLSHHRTYGSVYGGSDYADKPLIVSSIETSPN